MSELRRDPLTGRWIIVNTDEPDVPGDFEIEAQTLKGGTCPFCAGNEKMTPPEVLALRPADGAANGGGWSLRVVPNKFPALRIEGDLDRRGLGIYDLSNGIGAHEVIIETPDHTRTMAELTQQEMEDVLAAFQSRSLDLRGDPRFNYILIFKNQGIAAGASLEHTHSQLIALPIVPKRVMDELNGAEQYFGYRDRCIFCDILHHELEERERVIADNKSFVCFNPYVSRFAFETWIVPKTHRSDFAGITPEEIADFARMLREALQRMKQSLGNPPYNFIIHTAPMKAHDREEYHWHLELIPILTRVAGFEWGSGFYLNPTPPEVACQHLHDVKL
ncbi:MAG: galactose-1-phosphate uridylyltransferase [Candidatus Omnitrophica bacterium]|nr:galactose-1-phosphate uridylyltransferase [Candidatus Omnitrophota bacterium]